MGVKCMSIQKWSASQVAKKVINNEALFILDVRNAEAFEDWKMEGHRFEYLNIPYFELLDGIEDILPKIRLNKQY